MKVIDLFQKQKKQLAVLVDPDKQSDDEHQKIARLGQDAGVDFFFVGGSLLTSDSLYHCIRILKENSNIPVVLFPGNTYQVSRNADAMLFLSLISGRNPDMLIGMHVIAAPYIKLSGIETVPTGYMLIDSGKPTSVSYMSNSFPIPNDKKDIAACTAMAGEMLGLRLIFMDAGSGAKIPVPLDMIRFVKDSIGVPLLVGGGLRTPEDVRQTLRAGADIVVVGNRFEENPELITQFAEVLKKENR
ncbi:geranylgeranylglyceryl/heptaprenylglyceryl phosphate synthase [Candidatus Sulfidibacterium hydrothermale]|uniref:geranylgeranylglyceryl/heptaprenylglyceryl phosphate synthase n=1 Tax=Candidatus Sulfidibacterium hydrothermale TaxID=2875962 RepID=UPI001F0B3412|nr:geranylgeranylglyceryl/heptaprenylglyceryl phosphate synthase [Candidatus Sulfidibacterium hydrothermale]UBM62387.1 geranylgeranylglyceryl/heptaprenylglyceryl phosphate synthase [Candidatus Sulfidibacterium hydrothermale]